MNDDLRTFHKKLLVILHKACSEMRGFVQVGEQQRVYDLADTVEFIPELMLHWRPENDHIIRTALRGYQDKYRGSGFDYSSLLNMEDGEFSKYYLQIDGAYLKEAP